MLSIQPKEEEHNNIYLILATLREKGQLALVNP